MNLRRLATLLRDALSGLVAAAREQAVEALELEEKELETIFYTLVAAPLMGIPVAPTGLVLELLETLGEEELVRAVHRAALWADLFADYFSSLGGEW